MTVSIVMLGLAVVAAAAGAYAAYRNAEQQKQNLKAQARMQEDDAKSARLAAEAAAERQRKKDKQRLETFRSRAGAAGVVAGEGSSLLAEMDFASDSELEAQHLKYGYTLQARSKDIQAGFLRYNAAQIQPEMEAGISLLSSGGSIANAYYSGAGKGGGTTQQTTTTPKGGLTDTSKWSGKGGSGGEG